MKGFNNVILKGNLATTPELRYTEKKNPYVFITVAANYNRKKEDGTYESVADFINCTAWGKQAETIAKYFHKGSGIFIVGRLKQRVREIEKTNGEKQKIYGMYVSVYDFHFYGKKESDEAPADAENAEFPSDIPESYELDLSEDGEADIPF